MKSSLQAAVILAVALAQPAFAQTTTEASAVTKARQLRLEIEAKQKQLADSRNDAATPATPAAPLELPIDETDSPGATK
jgi:hypothetical protein